MSTILLEALYGLLSLPHFPREQLYLVHSSGTPAGLGRLSQHCHPRRSSSAVASLHSLSLFQLVAACLPLCSGGILPILLSGLTPFIAE